MKQIILFIFLIISSSFIYANNTSNENTQQNQLLNKQITELKRRFKIYDWSAKNKKTIQETNARIYNPLIEELQQQTIKNHDYAMRLKDKANEYKINNKLTLAKKYLYVANQYEEYSNKNKIIIKAYKEGNIGLMSKIMDEILEIEKNITKVTQKRVKREWFAESELQKAQEYYIKIIQSRRK